MGGGRAAGARARTPVTSGVDRGRHWDRVFEVRGPTGVSWYERSPRSYIATAGSAVRPGGHAVVGTFAEDGPAICSGLPVTNYDTRALADAFDAGFALLGSRRHEHRTPGEPCSPSHGWSCGGGSPSNPAAISNGARGGRRE